MSYPVYVLTGTVFFGLFSDGMAAPLRAVTNSKSLLIKVRFPREALLLTAWAQTLLSFLIRIGLLIVSLALLRAHISPTVPLALIPCFGLMLFGMMLGVLMVPLGALYQDITYGLVLLTSALMLVTPVAFAPRRAALSPGSCATTRCLPWCCLPATLLSLGASPTCPPPLRSPPSAWGCSPSAGYCSDSPCRSSWSVSDRECVRRTGGIRPLQALLPRPEEVALVRRPRHRSRGGRPSQRPGNLRHDEFWALEDVDFTGAPR